MSVRLSKRENEQLETLCRLTNTCLQADREDTRAVVQLLVDQLSDLFQWTPRQAQELLWELGLLTKRRRRIGHRTLRSYVKSLQDIWCIPTNLRPPSLQ